MGDVCRYPLLCGFHEIIVGKGFASVVSIDGRAMAESEDGSWWLYGVNPGAVAGTGVSLDSAVIDFRGRIKGVLADYASEAPDLDAFRAAVDGFFHETDPVTVAEWDAARAAVRAGSVTLNNVAKVADVPIPTVRVRALKLRPTENVIDDGLQIAA